MLTGVSWNTGDGRLESRGRPSPFPAGFFSKRTGDFHLQNVKYFQTRKEAVRFPFRLRQAPAAHGSRSPPLHRRRFLVMQHPLPPPFHPIVQDTPWHSDCLGNLRKQKAGVPASADRCDETDRTLRVSVFSCERVAHRIPLYSLPLPPASPSAGPEGENPLRGEKKKPTPTWSIGSSTLVCYEKFERIETSQPLLV